MSSSPSPPPRFDNVNLLRAFAALAVVVYHVIEHGHWSAFPEWGPLVTFRIGWIGVDIFFAISGFVITYSALVLYRRSPPRFAKDYWKRRLTRILPLYLLTLAVGIAFASPGFFTQPGRNWAWQLFTHLAFIHSFWPDTHGAIDGPNWSLAIEMHYYLAVALAIRWIDRTPGWRIWLACVLVSWAWRAGMLAIHGSADAWLLFVRVEQMPGCLDEFGAGMFLAKWVLDGRSRPAHAGVWLVAACAVGYGVMSVFWEHAGYWTYPAMVVLWRSAFSVFLLCLLGAAITLPQALADRWLRPVNYLGEISYGIYLWHLFAVQYVIFYAGYTGVPALLYVLALTLVAAALSWRYMEKPIMDRGRR